MHEVPVFYLPGEAPELWVWERLQADAAGCAGEPGIAPDDLAERMKRLDAVFDSASDTPSAIAKVKLRNLADALDWDAPDISRVVARRETGRTGSDIQPLVRDLEAALVRWRS